MVAALRRLFCSLRGHDALLHFEKGRISMRCTSCTWESVGWDLRPKVEKVVYMNLRVVRSEIRRIA